MNRMGLGLAIGAGYLLGRTKKLKMAMAVGSFVAGKKMNLTPKGVGELLNQQLRENPQFKEIGDQLREDLRGVGKAASGAMVERQIGALADRLHGRTAEVRKQLSGTAAVTGDDEDEQQPDDAYDEEPEGTEDEDDGKERKGSEDSGDRDEEPQAKKTARKAPAKKTAEKTDRKTPGKKTAGRAGAAAKKTAPGRKTAARSASRTESAKGGGER
ncbi:DNA primase [Streptomyces griseosporeus]|uniref:DNA primase n=1 Tax=Streptomyces griseosporeus TaxID=1910 RepID=UPI0036FFC510